jgi:CHASE3 domain sensor protein
MTVGTKLGAGFALWLAIVVVLGFASYNGTQQLIEANRRLEHTHKVLQSLEGLLSTLKDAETGQRGYLLTGEERYLDPYKAASEEIQHELAAVADLLRGEPDQLRHLDQIRALSQAKLAELQETIARRKEGGLDARAP